MGAAPPSVLARGVGRVSLSDYLEERTMQQLDSVCPRCHTDHTQHEERVECLLEEITEWLSEILHELREARSSPH
jgi:DNA repair exonuclease SbcCD ATPase subunit